MLVPLLVGGVAAWALLRPRSTVRPSGQILAPQYTCEQFLWLDPATQRSLVASTLRRADFVSDEAYQRAVQDALHTVLVSCQANVVWWPWWGWGWGWGWGGGSNRLPRPPIGHPGYPGHGGPGPGHGGWTGGHGGHR